MFIFFECAVCLILEAIAVTLLFAVCALFIVLKEGAAILGRLARGIADDACVLAARQTELIRRGLVAAGLGVRLNEHEEENGSVLTRIGSLLGRLREGQWIT